MPTVQLRDLCGVRSGDKGDVSDLSLFADSAEAYEVIRAAVDADRVKAHFGDLVGGDVELAGDVLVAVVAELGQVVLDDRFDQGRDLDLGETQELELEEELVLELELKKLEVELELELELELQLLQHQDWRY